MADTHQKNHDYHIIDPSPWPLLASIGAFILTFGGVCYMRYLSAGSFKLFGMELANPWLFYIGLVIVLYTMYHGGQTRSRKPMRVATPASFRFTCVTA